MKTSSVLFEELPCANGKAIAIGTLNAPKSLNALNLSMIHALSNQLPLWLADDKIAIIILQGAGDNAFCAGGDVVSIYHDLLQLRAKTDSDSKKNERILTKTEISNALAVEFFTQEYQLDELIHQASKPILALADGYVMGGGVGIMAGASHRVGTQRTVLSMPEISIGLYPDVGASWFLNQMPKGTGLFVGLTGCFFNAIDGQYLGLIDDVIPHETITHLKEQLIQVDWQTNERQNHLLLSKAIDACSQKHTNTHQSVFEKEQDFMASLASMDYIHDIYQAIMSTTFEKPMLEKAQHKLSKGSWLSAHLIFQQLSLCKGLTLSECFAHELALSLRCCQYPEFMEGVRALLVDKDQKPNWYAYAPDAIDSQLVQWFFNDETE